MPVRLQFDDWDRIVEELERFGAPELSTDEDTVRLEFDVAHIAVSRDGDFDAGMPLHGVDGDTAESLVVDHDADSITLQGESFSYTFRRPGR
jgi:hypothetical protein